MTEDTYDVVDGLFGAFFDVPFSLHLSRSGAYTVGKVTHSSSEGRSVRIQYAGSEVAMFRTDRGFYWVSLEGDFDEPADHLPFLFVAKMGREYLLNGGRVVKRRWRSDRLAITVDGEEWVLRRRWRARTSVGHVTG